MPTLQCENRKKEAANRRKPAGALHPGRSDSADRETGSREKLPQGCYGQFAQTVAEVFARDGVRFDQEVWTILADGTGICLATGQTMTADEVDVFDAQAAQDKAAGFGIKVGVTT